MSTRRVPIGISSAVLVYLAVAAGAFAQQPAGAFPYDEGAKRPGQLLFKKALENQTLPADDELKAMQDYIVKFSLPRLTLAANQKTLPEMRDLIKRDLDKASGGIGPAVEEFNKQALKTLTGMLSPRYNHKPVVRYNAVILIGELDQVVRKKGRMASRKAVPYAPALEDLTTWVGRASVPDYLKAAAMRGVLRHAEAGIRDPKAVASVQTAMLALLNGKTPPGKRTAKVHAWMRRRAADVLAAMKSVGVGNQVANALTGVMRDDTEPMRVRGTAAEALRQVLSGTALNTLLPEIKKTIDQAKASGATAATPTTPVAAKPRAKAGDPFPAP